ncbi:MAG: Extracellular serine protease precursor [Verrucomicrobiales bacterium]|nr:Extracellular serine protease precursor [Verrucomicrobiales bacterium]
MNPIFSLRHVSATLALLSSIFLGQSVGQAADRTWLGGAAGDSLWSTAGNWDATPVDGDLLIFSGTSRLSNTNDLTLTSTPGLRFDSDAFVLYGNDLTLSTGITNSTGTNTAALNLAWGTTGRFFSVASGSELVISGTNTIGATGDHTYIGGGRLRLKGTHVQAVNTPAMILNNIEYINDGGSLTTAGGVRITSGTTPTASKLILTNNAVFSNTVSLGNIRVGDFTGVSGQLIIDNSTMRGSANSIFIPNAAGGIGSVIQTGGTNTGSTISFCNNTTTGGTGSYDMIGGVLEPVQIKKVSANGTATISFDGSILRALSSSPAAFFTGLTTAEIKSGGLTNDSNGQDYTIGQALSGVGRLTKMGSGVVTLTAANTFSGGLTLRGGTVQIGNNAAVGTGTLSFVNTTAFRGNNATARTIGVPVSLGGNVTFSNNNLTFSGPATLTGNRTLTVENTNTFNGGIGETNGPRSLTMAGAGILILNSATNTYSGNTTISSGTLTLGASASLSNSAIISAAAGATFNVSAISGGFVVGSGKTLKGSGTVLGGVNVSGTLSPGMTVGTLTVTSNGAVTLNTGATYVWELNNAGADSLVASSLDIAATTLTLDITALETLTNWNSSSTTNWVLVHTTGGGITNFNANKFVIVDHFSASNSVAGGSFSVTSNGTDLSLQFSPSTGDAQSRVLTTATAGAATFSGLPNKGYTIQYTDSLGSTWQPLATVGNNGVVTTDGAGAGGFQDPTTPLPPQRYYRILNP